MKDVLFRLIYVSQNDIEGDDGVLRTEIDAILDVAREKNQAAGLTGALMFTSGHFAQVIEGAHDAIQAAFENILCDPRHSHIVVLTFEPATKRRFADWSMAFVGDEDATNTFADLHPGVEFDLNHLSGESVLKILQSHLSQTQGA